MSAFEGATPEQIERYTAARKRRMETIDDLPPEIRELVHDYGYTVVRALLDVGVKKPRQIKHVVETVLNEFSPTRGSYAKQGPRATVEGKK